MLFTTFKIREKKYCRVIDYIFYINCKCMSYLDMPLEETIGENGLPNAIFPSDHLNLVASFEL